MTCIKSCELCSRRTKLTKHHLIPRSRHARYKRNKTWIKNKIDLNRYAWLCRDCHSKIHATFTHKELDECYNTMRALRRHAEIRGFAEWIRKQQPDSRFKMK